ncbi:hypothetical protein E6O75_ATG02294 [Venturia nashicola]|uniref:Uncharacterized protein n=1 Tax=Venturia nashicola TaxID=86259 RepID=A0A4Z1PIT1_9PEZI|nr:hypothetical protein E6O75_ATG02294 [Venturia nashicola]
MTSNRLGVDLPRVRLDDRRLSGGYVVMRCWAIFGGCGDEMSWRSWICQNESLEREIGLAADVDLWNDVYHGLYFVYDQVSCKNQLMETAVAQP